MPSHEWKVMAILDAMTELTQAEIGELYDVSDKAVHRAKQRYEDGLDELGLD